MHRLPRGELTPSFVSHGTPEAHDAFKVYLHQRVIRSHRHPHNLKVVPQPSMPGPFRQVYLDVKGEQPIEQLRLAIKMMVAETAARNLFAAVLE
jgi:hypothetical protein